MTLYVVAAMTDGLIVEIKVFLSLESAQAAEQEWLRQSRIENEKDRKRLADCGTGITIMECPLRP